MKIIGLVGKIRSGKSTVGGMILDYYGDRSAVKLAFANYLKEMLLNAELCTKEGLWETKSDFSRLMMQKIGTEIIRKQVDQDFWVKKMREEIKIFNNSNKDILIVIDDVRFQNEADLIKECNGMLIRINRPSLEQNNEENKHASEIEQDNIKVDYTIINDGTTDELRQKVKEILKEI